MVSDVAEPRPFVVAYGEHESQFLEVHQPPGPGPHPVVVLIHGGFWRLPWGLDLMRPLVADLVRRGFAAVNLEYRRLGEPGGGWPGTCSDVELALRRLGMVRTAPGAGSLDLSRVGLVGHSAGGHLALWVTAALTSAKAACESGAVPIAPNVDIRAVVSLASVSDLRAAAVDRLDEEKGKPPAAVEFMRAMPEAAESEYRLASPLCLLPLGFEVAQLIVHGDLDNLVPIQQSLDYFDAAAALDDRVELARFPEMGHFEVLDPAHESWAASVAHLARNLNAQ